MASVVTIYANALILLGQTPILSEDEDSDITLTLKTRYPILRDRLLAQYNWKFTYKQVQLAKDPTPPTARYTYRYQVPGDSLSAGVIAVYQSDDEGAPHFQDYKIQNGYLLTNAETIFIEYKAPVPEEDFPPMFTDLLCNMLASDVASAITDDSTLTTRLDKMSKELLEKAIRIDSQSGPVNNRVQNYSLITAKRAGTGLA